MLKYVFITGCSSGIGLAAAINLEKHGFKIIASARTSKDVHSLREKGLIAIQLDMNDEESINFAAKQVIDISNGQLYAVINNAARGLPGAVEDIPTNAMRELFETNLFGLHHLVRLLLPFMLKNNKGRIIQISSLLGFIALKYRAAYTASKFALEGYSDTLRLELSGTGVHVIIVEPGPINTNFRKNSKEHFLKYINITESRHSSHYRYTLHRLDRRDVNDKYTAPVNACIPVLLEALNAETPKHRYRITLAAKFFYIMKCILPSRVIDKLIKNLL